MRTSVDVRITVGGEIDGLDPLLLVLTKALAEAGYPVPVVMVLESR